MPCGCNAAVYLVQMDAPGNDNANYCDIQGGDYPRCAEIDLLEGNTPFYELSLKLWEGLEQDFNFNAMVSQRGVINLVHTDGQRDAARRRGNAMRMHGVDAEYLDLKTIRDMLPFFDYSNARFPIMGGLIQRRGGTVRHDAVAWGFARGADRYGVDIIQNCEMTGVRRKGNKITGIETTYTESQAQLPAEQVPVWHVLALLLSGAAELDPRWHGTARWSNAHLRRVAGEATVRVEQRAAPAEVYGRGKNVRMPFGELLSLLERGDARHYMTTQDLDTDEEGRPHLMSAPCTQLHAAGDFPLVPSLCAQLVCWYMALSSRPLAGLPAR